MALIDEKYWQKLRDAGLFVCSKFPEGHPWQDGARVGKPIAAEGNSIAEYETEFDGTEMNAPSVVLFSNGSEWIVYAQDHTPTAGIGDFRNVWSTPDEAISDILDFYFGDSARMEEKAKAKREAAARIKEFRARKLED